MKLVIDSRKLERMLNKAFEYGKNDYFDGQWKKELHEMIKKMEDRLK